MYIKGMHHEYVVGLYVHTYSFAGIDNYDQMTDSSPYSVNGGGGLSPATGFSHNTLEVCTYIVHVWRRVRSSAEQ